MDPITAAALIGGGAQIFGGLLGSSGQSSANRANERIAQQNRDFQERMSNTAYQRAAQDLSKAGLNRVLALGSPASSPGGALAVMQNAKLPIQQGISNAAQTAMAVRKQSAEIKNIESQTALTDTRGLIAKHGEAVASLGADLARTVRQLTGNMTPEQLSREIKKVINAASGKLTDILEAMGTPARSIPDELERIRNDISIYINDTLRQDSDYNPNERGDSGYTEADFARKKREYEQLKERAKNKIEGWVDKIPN